MSEEMTVHQPAALSTWTGAAARGAEARKERQAIIKSVLVEGVDYGLIPGTRKPTLLKPGAEAILDALNLYPHYEPLNQEMERDTGWIHYRYRCIAKQRGSDIVVATGIGSCNSFEPKYRWREPQPVCPSCGQEKIIKGKKEYGGGWICWQKKGGCGDKFDDDDPNIMSQDLAKVQNPDILAVANTVDKMGAKRALVACALNLGFSMTFTQDLEDMAPQGLMDASADEEVKYREWKDKEASALAEQSAKEKAKPDAGSRFALCHMGHDNMKGQPFADQKPDDQIWYLDKMHSGAKDPENRYRKANAERLFWLVNWAMSHSTDLDDAVSAKFADIAADKDVVAALEAK